MTTRQVVSLISLSLLFCKIANGMDAIEHTDVSDVQKSALTALMFKGGLQSPKSLKKDNPLIIHHKGDFHLISKGKHTKIAQDRVKGLPKDLTAEQFKAFLEHGGYLWIDKDSEGDYFVEAEVRGLGGATAGFWIGRVGTYAVAGAVFGAISLASGPAALGTFYTLTQSFGPLVASAAEANAIGCSILGGVATGPV